MGAWSQIDLVYNDLEDKAQKTPFYIAGLKPIQVAAFDLPAYVEARREFSRDDWLDLVVRTIGLEPSEYDLRGKLLALTRLIPMVERNYNLIELGPWGTGKSFVYRESNPNSILISGGKVTVAQLFVNMSSGRVGLLGTWDVVAFDEVAGLQMSDSTVVNMLKDFMESGSFARGKEEIPAEASVVFIGNTSKPHEELVRTAHLFADLPSGMIDPAFLDRLHYYLPGWEAPKLEARLFTDNFGFVSDFFAEAMRQLRKTSQVRAIDTHFTLGSHLSARDERAVRKTVSGLVKIIHPHGEWSHGNVREYLEFAMEGRRRVKEQLKKLAPHDYAKTAFSYIENDTTREIWIDVPEQPDEVELEPEITLAEVEAEQHRTTAELIEVGESSSVEYKQTARFNLHTGTVDKNLEHSVFKSVAGFMNASGGVLLLGVHDEQQATGLDGDYSTTGNKGRDGFENWLITQLDRMLGRSATATLVEVSFDVFSDGDVCRIDVRPSDKPIYLGTDAEFYVRMGNSTRLYNTRDAMEYIRSRW